MANALSRRPNMGSDDPTVQVNVICVSLVTHNWLIQVTQSYRAYPLAKKILSSLATGDKLEHYTLTQGVIWFKGKILVEPIKLCIKW